MVMHYDGFIAITNEEYDRLVARAERASSDRDKERLLRKLYEDAAKDWKPRAQRAEARIFRDHRELHARAERAAAVLSLYAEAQRWAMGTEEHRLALQSADEARAALKSLSVDKTVDTKETKF